jgi:hypothetical protein
MEDQGKEIIRNNHLGLVTWYEVKKTLGKRLPSQGSVATSRIQMDVHWSRLDLSARTQSSQGWTVTGCA